MDWIVATPRLDPIDYVRKPQVILRIVILLFSLVVVSVIHTECYIEGICLFKQDPNACGFGLFIGSAAILITAFFMYFDSLVDNISNLNTRKTVVLVDISLSGICSSFWFIAFCLLCSRWQNTDASFIKQKAVSASGPRAVIAFTFFSLLCSGILTYIAYTAYKAIGALFVNGGNVTQQPEYTTPTNNTAYHGFNNDINMLDPNGPARLDTDSPPLDGSGQDYGNTNLGRTVSTYQGNILSGY